VQVLLIDDNQDITKMMSKFLKLSGHECTVSNDGRNGLSLIESQKWDVVLLDVAMPEFSGYDVVNSLEKNGKLKQNKIIMFTASTLSDDELHKLIERGVYSFLKKPVNLDELLTAIENAKKAEMTA
jgi:DNA-binding response OmpR family regulator